MTSVRVGDFRPSTHGLHFANTAWPHIPATRVTLPGGVSVPLGDAAGGLCGGMVYVVADLWNAGVAPPPDTVPPSSGPLYDRIGARQLDSFDLPDGAVAYAMLMSPAVPDREGGFSLLGPSLAMRMATTYWPAVRSCLDGSALAPLGLIRVRSWDLTQIGRNHQVLAYGYDLDGTSVTLAVYDPNHPDDDGVRLSVDLAAARGPMPVTYPGDGEPVFCFFPTAYAPVVPAAG